VRALLLLALLCLGAADPLEEATQALAAELRCPVCQNLSVADSPSEMATQMRAVIRDRLAAGESPAQLRAYFVSRYGEWILLAPPKHGFNWVAWAGPFAALGLGAGVLALVLRRATRRAAPPPPALAPDVAARLAAALREEERP